MPRSKDQDIGRGARDLGTGLSDRLIVITRASHQSRNLQAVLRFYGARVYSIPCMEINFNSQDGLAQALEAECRWADSLIFSSVNAVYGAQRLWRYRNPPEIGLAYAMGLSTYQGLRALSNVKKILYPITAQGSRGLKAMLEREPLAAKRFLSLHGEPTSHLIEPWLRERGAIVKELSLFRARSIAPKIHSILPEWTAIDCVVVSSIGTLTGFNRAIKNGRWAPMPDNTPLLTVSTRVSESARKMGWRKVYTSGEPDDSSMALSLIGILNPASHRTV